KLERKSRPTEVGVGPGATVADNNLSFELEAGPGPSTLMSKLMRAELERQNLANPISRLLNRAWILAPLLALCLGLIAWTFWPLNMETLYDRGAKLMASERLADMREAWSDYLEPLGIRYPEHPYQKEVESFRLKLKAAEAGQ